MGAKGIRRRKKYRRLPPPDVPTENELIPPHIMWPRSAFEAHTFSPAGRAQQEWRFLQGLTKRRGGRPFVVLALGVVLVPAVMAAVGLVVSLVG